MYRIGKEEADAVARVISTKALFRVNDGAREVDHFEREWAEKIGSDYCLCLYGGTQALIAALVGMQVGPGDEVIVPGYTFMATAIAVLAVGAIPVIAEIDDTMTLDPKDVEKKISTHTKAIIPVHMVGFPCNMGEIMRIAAKHNLLVLEDACQADGGSYKGKRLGTWGNAGAFSFNYYKLISCGEGGAIVTNDKTIYERALIYHDSGSAFRPYAKDLTVPIFIGTQCRANEIMGAILRVQLGRMDGILKDLRNVKKQFVDGLSGRPAISFARSNDAQGDCGTTIAFAFENEKSARLFAKSEGVDGWLPIDSGKHVYINWEPVLNKRGGSMPATNPYNFPQNQGLNMNYTNLMCPKTLDILKRTVYISLNPDWSAEEIERRIVCCKAAASKI